MVQMPVETKQAIEWAITQTWTDFGGNTHPITLEESDAQPLVDKVCEYFYNNGIEYGTFSYYDLQPFIEEIKAEQAAAEQPQEPNTEEQPPSEPEGV
jgi:hypothetical protein